MPIIGSLVEMPIGYTLRPDQGQGITDGAGNLHTQVSVRIVGEATRHDFLLQFPMGADTETLALAYHPEARFYRCQMD